MRVLHVIPSVSPAHGGPSFALPLIAEGLAQSGVQVDVLTTDGNGSNPEAEARNGVNYFHFRRQVEFYKVSLPMSRWLARNVERYDLVHIHALFSYASCAAARAAFKHRVPYVVRPLGVLNRWGMENRRRRLKRVSFDLIERRILRNAAAIHYTSAQEKLEAEEAGVKTASTIIPLGIDVSEFDCLPDPELFYAGFPQASGRRLILFLSRIDPKKGLDLLLPAFARLHTDDPKAMLVVAGDGDKALVGELKNTAERLKIGEQVVWTGFLSGEYKLAALAAASVFALPSYSENFGIAVVEALAAGLPCVLSTEVGVAPDVDEFEAGFVVPCRVDDLAGAMKKLMDDAGLSERLAKNAQRLATRRFSTQAMTASLISLYNRIAVRPELVVER